MNVESLRIYCLGKPGATEYFPFEKFDMNILAFRIHNRIFAMIDLSDPKWFVLKCEPELAIKLREAHVEITPAFHMNKCHWNQIDISGNLPENELRRMIDHSYLEVVKKLPAHIRKPILGLTDIF